MTESVSRRMAKGAVWMVLFKLGERSLGVVSTLILARLLSPTDFGIVAMALSFIIMAELLTAFGFDIAIIQNQGATKDHYNTAWTGNFLLGLSITVLMLGIAAPIADFYRKPEVVWVVCALAFGPLLKGAENIGIVAFRKELNFRREFLFQISRKLVGFAVVVPMAFLLRSYWALVAGIIVSKLAGTVLSYLMHPFRPHFTMSQFRQMFAFSRWLLLNNIFAFFKERSSDFFIGRLLGAAPLGTYNIAYELANLPSTEISAPINRALLPGFAKMEASSEIATAYGNAVGILAMLALPAAAGIFAVAPFLVPVVLGSKWLDTIPLMEVLAFNGALLLFHSSVCAILIGRGFPARVTITNVSYVVILIALLTILSMHFGVIGAAYAALLTSIACTPIYLYQMKHCLGVTSGVFAKAVARPLTAALVMAATVRWAMPPYAPTIDIAATVAWLVGGVALGVITYVAVVVALWQMTGRPQGAERFLFDHARAALIRRLGLRFSATKD